MSYKGQAKFPLLLIVVLLAGFALSQGTDAQLQDQQILQEQLQNISGQPIIETPSTPEIPAAPPTAAWSSASSTAEWSGEAFTTENTLALGGGAAKFTLSISGCPLEWLCDSSTTTFEYDGTPTEQPVKLTILAPKNAKGTIIVTASSEGTELAKWEIAISSPTKLSWQKPTTTAFWLQNHYESRNRLKAKDMEPGQITISISSCPLEWVCAANVTSIEHGGTNANYNIGVNVIAPEGSTGTVYVSATNIDGVPSGEWPVFIVPSPPAEQKFEDIYGCETLETSSVLQEDIQATASDLDPVYSACIILAPNPDEPKVLDCQGYSIIGEGNGKGIFYEDMGESGWEIKNCVIENFEYGLHTDSANLIVRNTDISNTDTGWFMGGRASPTLGAIDTTISESNTGILFLGILPNIFTNVVVENSRSRPFIFDGILGNQQEENSIENLTAKGRGYSLLTHDISITNADIEGIDFEHGNEASNRVRLQNKAKEEGKEGSAGTSGSGG